MARRAKSQAAAQEPAEAAAPHAETPETETESEGTPAESAKAKPAAEDVAQQIQSLRAELAAEREARARLEGKLEAKPAAEPPKPKDLTRAELRQAVDNGTLSEDRMAEILEQQAERRVAERLEAQMEAKLAAERGTEKRSAEVARYLERIPALAAKDSPEWQRVSREYRDLVALGAPEGAATEIAALRAVHGPAEKIPEKSRTERERHEETGGAADAPASHSWQKGLDRRQIRYYADRLDRGFYTGSDDPTFQRELAIARGGDPRKLIARERSRTGQPGERQVQ